MRAIEVPWTYTFTLPREDDHAFVDSWSGVLGLVYNITRQAVAYFGQIGSARLQCRGSSGEVRKTAVSDGVRYDFEGVAVIKPFYPTTEASVSYENYVQRMQETIFEPSTPEDFLMQGLYNTRTRVDFLRGQRARAQETLAKIEVDLIQTEQREREYIERMKAMGVQP